MAKVVSASAVARRFRAEVRERVAQLPHPLTLCGLLSKSAPEPSRTYAHYTRAGCEDVGIRFELREVPRLSLEAELRRINADPSIHGVMIYYPVFGTQQDVTLKDLVALEKDVEGLHAGWIQLLYDNVRTLGDESGRKAILPCTPLAIVKVLEANGVYGEGDAPLAGQVMTVFNRSEVVGRPLASMLANDGARVYSFDIDGPLLFERGGPQEVEVTRAQALAESQVVITGVPSASFELVRPEELREGAVCVNFSTRRNFAPEVKAKAGRYLKRVGPVTVAMCLRNTLRLYDNFHRGQAAP